MPGENKDASQAFKELTAGDGNWEDIKKKYSQSEDKEQKELGEQVHAGQQKLKDLIELRDLIDFKMYSKAVETLFPSAFYNLDTQVGGDIDRTNLTHPKFKASWYEFVITHRGELPRLGEQKPRCIIKVNAPGSRNLTSDIDTSILTQISGNAVALLRDADARIRNHEPDYAGRITTAIIDGFYTFSEHEFKTTSGEHRDSNAYADLSTNDNEEYPKFNDNDTRNPQIGKERLFKSEDLARKLADWKLKKHRLEMAASLFSLRLALENEAWETFKKDVATAITACGDKFLEDSTPKGEKACELYCSLTKKDLNEILKKTEALYDKYEKRLDAKRKELEKPASGWISSLQGNAKHRDLEVAALNRLYVEELDKMTGFNGQILALREANVSLLKEAVEVFSKLEAARDTLTHLLANKKASAEFIPQAELKGADLQKQYDTLIEKLKANHLKVAELELQKLESRYQAHTFANEAYVCRSAVEHVVKGVQSKGDISLTERTILASMLQQTGFKLLHSQALIKHKKPPEEVAYRTAKYGQRVYQLLISQPVEDGQIKAVFKSHDNRINILGQLKPSKMRDKLYGLFSEEELLRLNVEMRIISKVKNNAAIPETRKYQETTIVLQGAAVDNLKSFLSIATKTIAAVYLSKFERRQRLWGGLDSPMNPPQITFMLEKLKGRSRADEKLALPSVAASAAAAPPLEHPAGQAGAFQDVSQAKIGGPMTVETIDKSGKGARTYAVGVVASGEGKFTTVNEGSPAHPR